MLWTKTPGPQRVAERRTGISSLGIPDWGPWVGAMVPPRSWGQPGGWLPRFPLAPMRVTPSFTRKSSLSKIPHAAGKRKKGQNDVGVRVINHLVHKNCLITGKMWKSTYYSEQQTLRAVQEWGGGCVSGCWELHASSSCRKCQNSSYPHPHHVITYKASSVPIEGNITHMRIFCLHFTLK